MWTQIVGGLLLLIVGTYAIQFFMPRAHSTAGRTSARMDVAPALGFFGVLLVILSFVESIRSSTVEAWALGIGVGVIAGIGAWVVLGYRVDAPVRQSRSALLETFRLIRAMAIPVIGLVIGIYLVVRIFGPVVEVLLASALGVCLIIVALRIFIGVRKTVIS